MSSPTNAIVVGLFGIPETKVSTLRLGSVMVGPELFPPVWLANAGRNDMEIHRIRRNALTFADW
ncbi:MAG: hypothetical protein EB163_02205 [Nitrososphaeria archaeon]|nr:hypothetical protein [Nitrososphaeria archaeon]